MKITSAHCLLVSLGLFFGHRALEAATPSPARLAMDPAHWRAAHRLIDLHQHINGTTQHLDRAVRIMDAVGIGLAVNLSGGTVTRGTNGPSQFERIKSLADARHPGRFLHYLNLDFRQWNEPDFPENAVRQVEEGARLGAAGLKEYKRLGLYLRDARARLIRIDDPRLDPMWKRCGELNLPVSIHVADPKAFWDPFSPGNERWTELKDHRSWWFGDTNTYPPRMELLGALDRVIARHPKTTFVCVHFANNAEDLEWVDQALTRNTNMMADLAARIPEVGRHDPAKVRALFLRHQDRILFATDFQVYDRLILGSSGNEPPPSDADAHEFFARHWRWLETADRNFAHMTPIQGDWTISGIALPPEVLRKIYFDNARKLLSRSLPRPTLRAAYLEKDFALTNGWEQASWKAATPVVMDQESRSSRPRPEMSTTVRALWSDEYLYLQYVAPYTRLTTFDPPLGAGKRIGLWDRDVVEAFIGSDPGETNRYLEFEVAPTNERLDLKLALPDRDFVWTSGWETVTRVDALQRTWSVLMRIPLKAWTHRPAAGQRWPANFYRADHANNAFLAWRPTLTGTFHTPERFGWIEFVR